MQNSDFYKRPSCFDNEVSMLVYHTKYATVQAEHMTIGTILFEIMFRSILLNSSYLISGKMDHGEHASVM